MFKCLIKKSDSWNIIIQNRKKNKINELADKKNED